MNGASAMSKSRVKGTSWESAIVNFLAESFPTARRTGSADFGGGDIVGISDDLVIEAKNVGKYTLADWVAQAEAAGERRGAWLRVVWAKRVGKSSPGDGYVIMSGHTFHRLLVELDGFEVDE
jgi:hypothetical protein